jgi:hypothetical protein
VHGKTARQRERERELARRRAWQQLAPAERRAIRDALYAPSPAQLRFPLR